MVCCASYMRYKFVLPFRKAFSSLAIKFVNFLTNIVDMFSVGIVYDNAYSHSVTVPKGYTRALYSRRPQENILWVCTDSMVYAVASAGSD